MAGRVFCVSAPPVLRGSCQTPTLVLVRERQREIDVVNEKFFSPQFCMNLKSEHSVSL